MKSERMESSLKDHLKSIMEFPAPKMSVRFVMLFLKLSFLLLKIHRFNMIAFDIKEDNFMMRNPFNPVLIDLGTLQTYPEAI